MVFASPATSVDWNAIAEIADVDIVTARREIDPAEKPNPMLLLPIVLLERIETVGRVVAAGGVVKERAAPLAVLAAAGSVA